MGEACAKTGWQIHAYVTDEQLAERLVREGLAAAGWQERTLTVVPKRHPLKVEIATRLRQQTPMTRLWIASRLHMGSPSYVSALASVDCEN